MIHKSILKINLVISVIIFAIVCSIAVFSFLINSNPSSVFAKTPPNCFDANLTGKSEVPSKSTKAVGFVELNAVNGNNGMTYKINVTNMEKATSVHLHQGKVGENGPSMVILFKTDFPSTKTDGFLSAGNITSVNLEKQSPVTNFKDLINMINNRDVYIHVHTVANPVGEIRGQLLPCNVK